MPPRTTKKTITQLRNEVSAPTSQKDDQILSNERSAARTTLKDLSVEKVLTNLATLSVDLGSTLSAAGEKIRLAFATLDHLNVAVKEQEDRLQDLHDIDSAATTLSEMVAEHDRMHRELAAQTQALQDNQSTTRVQIASQDALFQQERQSRQQREQEAYQYQVAQQRQKDQDQYQHEKTLRDRAENEARAQRMAIVEARETAVKTAEKELAELRAQVVGIPVQTKKEVDAAVAIATNSLKRNMEHEAALATQKLQSELALAHQAKNVVEKQMAIQANEIDRLNKETASYREQVQNIAVKALESASGARALDEVRSVAKEMAQGGGKSSK